MENLKKPTKRDQMILDYYSKIRMNEEGNEVPLPKGDLESKREIWSLNKMENLTRNDETLTNRYNEMAVDGPFKFGYHWNEVIMNILFNEYVLADRRYMERYLNTKEVPKKRRGNPDGKIDDKDFVDYNPKKDHKFKKRKKSNKPMKDKEDSEFTPKKKFKKPMKKKEGIEETTSTGSAGGSFVGSNGEVNQSFAYTTKLGFIDKPDAKKALIGVPGGSVVMRTDESKDYLTNPKMFESIIEQLEEEKRHSAMVLRDRLAKQNEKNFYDDLKNNKEISDSVKKAATKADNSKIKSSMDLEKEQMKREFKPVKFDQKEDFKSEYNQITKGMEDLDYDIEPSDKFKERVKKEMGEEIYDKGRERVELKKEQPMYKKDGFPSEDPVKYKKKFEESYHLSTKYKDQFNKMKFVDFRLDESLYNDDCDNFIKLNFAGIGNTYTSKVELNESVKNILDNYEFYYDNVNDIIYHKKISDNINESMDLNKFKHLTGYNPSKYVSTKGNKK
jgi:hypothetical protein